MHHQEKRTQFFVSTCLILAVVFFRKSSFYLFPKEHADRTDFKIGGMYMDNSKQKITCMYLYFFNSKKLQCNEETGQQDVTWAVVKNPCEIPLYWLDFLL